MGVRKQAGTSDKPACFPGRGLDFFDGFFGRGSISEQERGDEKMKKNEQLLKISDFAKLCGVTKDTLFHYEDIGILKPEIIRNNGYRYYNIQQFFTFEIISILKEAGTPLKEIKWYIEHLDVDHYIALLSDKLKVLKDERTKLDRMINILQNTINTTDKAVQEYSSEPRIEEQDEQYLLAVNLSRDENEKDRIAKIFEQYKYCLGQGISQTLPAGFIIEKSNLEKNIFDNPDFYFCEISSLNDDLLLHTKPKGRYAVINHRGSYDNIVSSAEKLVEFIRVNGLAITGDAYVFELLGFLAVGDENKYLVKIAIGVG
jgi:DNA-binding transcriptional MerR regulator